jgi:hypothetical protein
MSVVSMATPARAAPEDGAELQLEARQLYLEGVNALHARQWDRARLFFLSAFRAQHHWQIAANLANVELRLGHYRDAAEHAATFLRDTRDLPDVDAYQRAEVLGILTRAREKVGVITVTVEPAGAEVRVNGSSLGEAPLRAPIYVAPGRTVIEARRDGYVSKVEARNLAPGGEATVDVRLMAVAPVLAPVLDAAPPESPVMPPASDGGARYKAIVISGSVLSATAAGVGSGLTGWWSHLQSGNHCYAHDEPTQQCKATWAGVKTASVWSFVGAGVLGVGTLTYGIAAPRSRQLVRTSVLVGPTGASASLSMDW